MLYRFLERVMLPRSPDRLPRSRLGQQLKCRIDKDHSKGRGRDFESLLCWRILPMRSGVLRAGKRDEELMQLLYGWEKLSDVCQHLDGSGETLQKRLAAVVSSDLLVLRRENLPNDEVWRRVRELIRATTCKHAKGCDSTIEATTSQMTDDEAGKWLSEIRSLFSEVAEQYRRFQGEGQAATR
jgi:hypothetical protein